MTDAGEILFGVSSFLSLISTGFLISIYALGRIPRTFAFHLVFMVCLNNFLWSLVVFPAIFYDYITEDAYLDVYLCNIQAFVMCFATNSGFLYVISISSSLVKIIIKKEDMAEPMRNPIKYYFPVNILIPILMATLPIILQRYDHLPPFENVQCYLIVYGLGDLKGLLLRIFTYYAPYLFAITYQIFTIIRIFLFVRKSQLSLSERSEIKTLILYPFILCLTQTWLLVSRSCEIFAGLSIDWLNHINLFFFSLEGFFNVLVYGVISLDICKGIKMKLKKKSQISENFRIHDSNNDKNKSISSNSDQKSNGEIEVTLRQQNQFETSSCFTINSDRADTYIYARDSQDNND